MSPFLSHYEIFIFFLTHNVKVQSRNNLVLSFSQKGNEGGRAREKLSGVRRALPG